MCRSGLTAHDERGLEHIEHVRRTHRRGDPADVHQIGRPRQDRRQHRELPEERPSEPVAVSQLPDERVQLRSVMPDGAAQGLEQ